MNGIRLFNCRAYVARTIINRMCRRRAISADFSRRLYRLAFIVLPLGLRRSCPRRHVNRTRLHLYHSKHYLLTHIGTRKKTDKREIKSDVSPYETADSLVSRYSAKPLRNSRRDHVDNELIRRASVICFLRVVSRKTSRREKVLPWEGRVEKQDRANS